MFADGTSGTSQYRGYLQYSHSSDTLIMAAAGNAMFNLSSAETVINDQGFDHDFRVESDNNSHALYVDGADGNVGINSTATNARLEVVATSGEILRADAAGGAYRLVVDQTGVNMNGNVNVGAGLRLTTDGSNNGVITTLGQDKDLYFSGDDGGAGINALVLDMSAAGAATFNSTVTSAASGTTFNSSTAGGYIQVAGSSSNFWAIGSTGGTAAPTSASTSYGLHNWNGSAWSNPFSISNAGAATFGGSITATAAAINGQLNVTGTTNSNNIYAQQLSTQFDTSSFLRLHPTSTTDNGGFTNIFFGTSTANNYGVAVGGKRGLANPEPFFAVRMLNDSTTGTEVLNITNAGEVTKPYQPAFYATPSSAQSNIAANDSAITVDLGTEIYDVGGNFASSTFTAPVTGKYQLNLSLYLTTVDTGASYVLVGIVTSNRNYINILAPKYASDPAYLTQNISTLADMDANDTAYAFYQQSGGAAQTDVQNDTRGSFFQGYLVA